MTKFFFPNTDASGNVYVVTPTGSSLQTVGNVASGAVDNGNPVKTGAVYSSTLPSPSTGQRVDSQSDTRGNHRSRLITHIASGFDGVSNTTNGFVSAFDGSQNALDLSVAPRNYNTRTGQWDRMRGDVSGVWMSGAGIYEPVAASATNQILGATGAVGDYLARIIIVPATTTPGAVSISDGNGSAITIFPGGTVDVKPIVVEIGAKAINATTPGWKVTTGLNVSVLGVGMFT